MSYGNLMGEVDCIREAWGYTVLEAIIYIQANQDEYVGTKVYNELRQFMAAGAKMFAPIEETA